MWAFILILIIDGLSDKELLEAVMITAVLAVMFYYKKWKIKYAKFS
jgi:hypothetical protein